MALQQGLFLRNTQHLTLTPQLQQSIKLLQLSTLELSQEISQALHDNPFLDAEDNEQSTTNTNTNTNTEEDFSTRNQDHTGAFDAPTNWDGDGNFEPDWDDDPDARPIIVHDPQHKQLPLSQHLYQQTLDLKLHHQVKLVLCAMIESLDADGYLRADELQGLKKFFQTSINTTKQSENENKEQQPNTQPENQLPKDSNQFDHLFATALQHLQSMEPCGIGAVDLQQCLLLQLNNMPICNPVATALLILQHPIGLLARRDVKKLAQLCKTSAENIKKAIGCIVQLEPKPGRCFNHTQLQTMVPDVILSWNKSDQCFKAQINPDVLPKLRVNEMYAKAIRQHKPQANEEHNLLALQQRLQEARWFIKSIQQRFDTLIKVSNAIIDRQRDFLTHGELAMKPLVLKEIAQSIGMHESTISRITTAKYMQTPFGVFELKYFFSSGLSVQGSDDASSTAVRGLIKRFIELEASQKPLSDQKIANMLQDQGIDCARRTVTKYRESLKIAPTHLRKTL